jgi:hypothetical protein
VPAFVGFAAAGMGVRVFDRWEQFLNAYRDAAPSDLLAFAVRGFFENGGERCVVVPVGVVGRENGPDSESSEASEGRRYTHAMLLARALAEPFVAGGVLEQIEDIDLVCIPDAMTPDIARYPAWVFDIQAQVVGHCGRMGNRFAILDGIRVSVEAPEDEVPADELKPSLLSAIAQWQTLPADYGALYFPWIRVKTPGSARGPAAEVVMPPCGHIAGVYARSDRRVGVHKAPANELLEGALNLDTNLSDADQANLNEAGVNCLREWPGWGIRVWGARTLSERLELRYVNVTRVILTFTRWLETNLRDFVFESNDPALWRAIEDRVRGYLQELHSKGALKGLAASEAFFVKCNAETNSAASRDAGTVHAEAGLAVAVPAEFVIVRITQSAAGVTVGGPATQG